jgi:alpha-glucosidase
MNGPEPHTFDVPLSFLDAARQYVAHIYSDDPAIPTPTHVKVEHRPVKSQTVLTVVLPARGGQAIHITRTRN